MAKVKDAASDALRAHREKLAILDEMGRANMTDSESREMKGYKPGSTRDDMQDSTERALATKNQAEADEFLRKMEETDDSANRTKKKMDDKKKLQELKDKFRVSNDARIARIEEALILNDSPGMARRLADPELEGGTQRTAMNAFGFVPQIPGVGEIYGVETKKLQPGDIEVLAQLMNRYR
jgi:hypothetical protein